MSKRVLLIDGDVLVYKTAFAAETVIDWGDDLITLHSRTDEAAATIDAQIATIKKTLEGDEVVVALTCHETVNFRKSFYPEYKENRTEKRKPIAWKAMRQHLLDNHAAKTKPNLEADDILGILATMKSKNDRIIVSIDKDFKTIPGKFYDMKKGDLHEVTELEADFNFMVQTLTGDSTDNYPGCTGIGPKKAEAILRAALTKADNVQEKSALWQAVLKQFDKAGFGADYALTQARCARILRASDYDFTNKQPILWSPPS